MSCNGCRILRKGCNDNCILRESLQGIENPQSQSNATVFVAKFFGRAGLISFLSSVPQSQRPALFQSLLFEACGRTINPVTGAVGLISTGNWHVCQSAVETVLRGGVPRVMPEFSPDGSEGVNGVDLVGSTARMTAGGRVKRRSEKHRSVSPPSDESDTTSLESGFLCQSETKLLQLFY